MFNLTLKIENHKVPFNWINFIDLFDVEIAKNLVETYPVDNYRTIVSNTSRQYNYDVRALTNLKTGYVEHKDSLSESWLNLANYINSKDYKNFICQQTGIDVLDLPVEVNVYKYAKNCFMDAHQDLNIKVLTQVIYFNDEWDEKNGGYLSILNSKNTQDIHEKVMPIVGNSVIIIRSENSWHSVEATTCEKSRRSVTITFYKKGSSSPMWIDPKYPLHNNID